MADYADQASRQQSIDIAQAIANFDQYRDRIGRYHEQCIECGTTIPEPRKAAVPNCTTCLPCQERYEKQGGFWP